MRITDNMRIDAARLNQARSSNDLYAASEKASSGLKVEMPSDDPGAYAQISKDDAQLAKLNARKTAVSSSQDDLDLAESTLASANDVMTSVQQVAVDMANGDKTASARADAATQIAGLRDQLMGLANTKGTRGYLFGGTKTDTQPFDASGNFNGNDGEIDVEVADGVTAASNPSGAKAFTAAGGTDVLKSLDDLATALSNNDQQGVQNLLGTLQKAQSQIIDARSVVGLTLDRFSSASDVTATATLKATAARANLAEADSADAYTELTKAQSAYERNLSVTARILSVGSGASSSSS